MRTSVPLDAVYTFFFRQELPHSRLFAFRHVYSRHRRTARRQLGGWWDVSRHCVPLSRPVRLLSRVAISGYGLSCNALNISTLAKKAKTGLTLRCPSFTSNSSLSTVSNVTARGVCRQAIQVRFRDFQQRFPRVKSFCHKAIQILAQSKSSENGRQCSHCCNLQCKL